MGCKVDNTLYEFLSDAAYSTAQVCDASGGATCFVARPINNRLPENVNKRLV